VRGSWVGAAVGASMEEAIDTGRKIAAAGEKRSREKGHARARTQARDLNQRGGERNGAIGVSGSGLVVGGPFREFCPSGFEGPKWVHKRKNVGCEEKEKTLGVVAGAAVRLFVGEGGVEFFTRKNMEHATRNQKPRTKQAGQGEKRSFMFNDYQRGRITWNPDFLGSEAAKPVVA
jgi:hypothetical protein